jgi:hypothetical protein
MTALVLGTEEIASLKAALARARIQPIPWAVLETIMPAQQSRPRLDLADRKPGAPERPPAEMVMLPLGWTVAVSVEEQPIGKLLHVSISSPRRRLPHPEAARMILSVLGVNMDDSVKLWDEEYVIAGKSGRAINLLFRERRITC